VDATPVADGGSGNLEVLRKLVALQRSIIEKQESRADIRADLQLLDNKLNMALDLLGDLFQTLNQLPALVPVELSSATVEWEELSPPQVDEQIGMRLYLSEHYPRPLILLVRIVSISLVETGSRVRGRFELMDAPTQDELERLVFLLHRQAVAQARRV